MYGRRVGSVALLAAVVGVSTFCASAADVYDRQLENWAKQVVARKIGEIRGTIEQEWRPPQRDIDAVVVAPPEAATGRVSAVINVPPIQQEAIADSTSGRMISASIESFGPVPVPLVDPPARSPAGPPAYPLRVIPLHRNGG